VLQLQYPERSSDILARKNLPLNKKCPRQGIHVSCSTDRTGFAVGLPQRPVEAPVLELQSRQTELSDDSLGADPIAERHRGHR